MTTNIILAGVGGQGILSIAGILDVACLNNSLFFKQSEIHGMSQRGGAVSSHVRISDDIIYSDLIPYGQADIILATEPMELLRQIPYLKKDGWLITDSNIYDNTLNYPDQERLLEIIATNKNHLIIEATEIAKKIGSEKVANMVLLGALSHLIILKERALRAAIKVLFDKKGERILQLNIAAFEYGTNIVIETENEH